MRSRTLSDGSFEVLTASSGESCELGRAMGKYLFAGLAILFFGELGSGKTTLTKGIGAALNIVNIKSPSFIIVSEHEGALPFVHADLYRLENPSGVDSLALDEYTEEGRVLVVEWAERIPDVEIFPQRWIVSLDTSDCGDSERERRINIKAFGADAVSAFDELVKNVQDSGESQ